MNNKLFDLHSISMKCQVITLCPNIYILQRGVKLLLNKSTVIIPVVLKPKEILNKFW